MGQTIESCLLPFAVQHQVLSGAVARKAPQWAKR